MEEFDLFESLLGDEDWKKFEEFFNDEDPIDLRMTPNGIILVAVMEHVSDVTQATSIASSVIESLIIHGYEIVSDNLSDGC